MDQHFGGIIWTTHALKRMAERGVKQGDAWATWHNPEQTRRAASGGAWIYYRTYGKERIEVVATKNEKREWVVLSVWSRPIYRSSYHTYTNPKWNNLLERILNSLLGWAKRK